MAQHESRSSRPSAHDHVQDEKTEQEEVSSVTGHKFPYVSEAHEGKPWFEWCVAACVLVTAVLALFGQALAATIVLSVTAFITATVRLVLRHKSPWKVRSIAFDCIIGYALSIGLPLTLLAIDLISH